MIAVLCGTLTACALFWLLRSGWARAIALDRPNERSLHQQPIPRSGGLVLILVASMPAFWLGGYTMRIGVLALILMIVSAVDDRTGLPVLARLLAHVALATAAAVLIFGTAPWWLLPLAAVAIVWGTNAFNFMDGSDGMAGGMAVFGFGSYALQAGLIGHASLTVTCAAIAGSAVGFLVFNFAPARVFMGDAGSAPLGFLAASLGLLGWLAGVWPAWFPLVVFSPFLVDATLTLLARLARGEKVWQAHKEHLYQRMVAGGLGHTRTALIAYGVMAASAGIALLGNWVPGRGAAGLAVAWLASCVALYLFWGRQFGRT
jgi:UDP-N-acetylmuramyl pentapeptide phosphotransferase/UDP-N-acetylglucosamine-1-phosphate transferase